MDSTTHTHLYAERRARVAALELATASRQDKDAALLAAAWVGVRP